MPDPNITFSRELMKRVHAEVHVRLTELAIKHVRPDLIRCNIMKSAWVWSGDRRNWEFHGPDQFVWHGRAHNAYEARAKGWQAWLENPNGNFH